MEQLIYSVPATHAKALARQSQNLLDHRAFENDGASAEYTSETNHLRTIPMSGLPRLHHNVLDCRSPSKLFLEAALIPIYRAMSRPKQKAYYIPFFSRKCRKKQTNYIPTSKTFSEFSPSL